MTGIGRDAAAKIWYRALTVYMTSGTTYQGARTATLNAARDLYGAGSAQQNAVAAAWSGVNVSLIRPEPPARGPKARTAPPVRAFVPAVPVPPGRHWAIRARRSP